MNDEDYYMNDDGFVVMTSSFLLKRGYCCGSGCKHCPYIPKHKKGTTIVEWIVVPDEDRIKIDFSKIKKK